MGIVARYDIGTAIEFSFELLLDSTGAPITGISNPILYVIVPGATSPTVVAGAIADHIQGGSVSFQVPDFTFTEEGLYSFFARDGQATSKGIKTVLYGVAGILVSADIYVPFAARDSLNIPILGLTEADLSVSYTLGSSSTKTLVPGDVIELVSGMYLLRFDSDEVNDIGTLSYVVDGAGVTSFGNDIPVASASSFLATFKLNPILDGVSLTVISESGSTSIEVTGTTDGAGEVNLIVTEGDRVVRLRKPGVTFSANDIPVVIEYATNLYTLDVESVVDIDPSPGFCKVFFKVIGPTGAPLRGVDFIFESIYNPTGSTVVSLPVTASTNENGYGEIFLLPGLQMRVTMGGVNGAMRILEEFEVPDESEKDLFELISLASRNLEEEVGDFPSTIRRTVE